LTNANRYDKLRLLRFSMNNATIQIRTDPEVKERADSIFNQLGITLSDGINIFLRQVNLHNGFPFEVRLNRQEQPSGQKDEQIAGGNHAKNGNIIL
jgi:DNA-damage-inducible protein J